MLHGHLRPGYDYLLACKLTVTLREAAASPLGADLARFLAGAGALGYSVRAHAGMASQIAIRMLIQTGRGLAFGVDPGTVWRWDPGAGCGRGGRAGPSP